ncbi:MAG: OmpH family outer membrane protein [Saprospiraceae bacterium]|nr:OmpH family outer membrane protein [Saprospiraceae bacterium]MBP7699852.1 OmpH family outer membrane protein [Saprospiraceae bacterium]
MKNLRIFIVTISLTIFSHLTHSAFAQKFGYVNSSEILASLAEVKAADSELDSFQKILQKQGQKMVEDLQAKYAELDKKQKSGTVAPKEIETEATKLREEESKITAFETNMRQQIQEKRETLLKPILDKVNQAINDVAKEKAFQYIFDTSTGVILYADESVDISKDVKTKLGL